MSKHILQTFFVAVMLSALLMPGAVAQAQTGCGGGSTGGPGIDTEQDVVDIICQVRDFVLFLGGAAVVVAVIFAGISFLMARGDEQKLAQAKQNLIWVIVGVAVILGVGVILATISQIVNTGKL